MSAPTLNPTVEQRRGGPARLLARAVCAAVALTVLGGTAVGVAHAGTDDDAHQVLLVGTGGVSWADVSPTTTPALWSLAEDGSVGNLVVRSVNASTCPVDGWLAISAGTRAADAFDAKDDACRELAPATGGALPEWDELREAVDAQSYDAPLGAFGDAVTEAGTVATAVGPGAALALTTQDGDVAGTAITPGDAAGATGDAVADGLETSDLVVVDLGAVREAGYETETTGGEVSGDQPRRAQDVTVVDARLAEVLAAARDADPGLEHTTVVLASVADPSTEPRLQVAAVLAPGEAPGTLLSSSTRQPGYVQGTDVLPTVLDHLDITAQTRLVGASWTSDTAGTPAQERVADLVDAEDHTLATRPLVEPFFLLFCAVNLVLFAAVSYGFSARARRNPRIARTVAGHPGAVLGSLRATGIAIAALPVSTLLANLVPWWRTGAPALTLTALVLAWMAALTALAVLPPWRHRVLGPATVVTVITALVLAVDVATGARLQVSALMGIQPTVGGRFYGFNNTAFALFAVTTVLAAAAAADPLVAAGRRRLAAGVVLTIGAVAVVLNGSPALGADFGGPPALVPAFVVLALLAAGVRLTWQRIVGVLLAAVVVVTTFAVADRLRPEEDRTHLGQLVDTVLDGGLLDVVLRKAEANLSTLTNPLAIVGVAGILVVVLVLGRPLRAATLDDGGEHAGWWTDGAPLTQISTRSPMVLPGVVTAGTALGIGTLVNDSGVVILGVGLAVLVPLVAATYASWMLTLRRDPAEQEPLRMP
ncbi:hypothetical protein [Sanguibacter suaedae]|uniref:Uncharacterized protein n=1 Tax=Sanguibacter suaedae TaxID=2795737 RepID=A0A934I1Q0_9MICO|nr:hypothetical protein [Sanguibacter suaedae]MBI9113568.1 hypothetical protein [Sanguibacter suaedae]